jgi:hypothetical protein
VGLEGDRLSVFLCKVGRVYKGMIRGESSFNYMQRDASL